MSAGTRTTLDEGPISKLMIALSFISGFEQDGMAIRELTLRRALSRASALHREFAASRNHPNRPAD